MHNSKPASFSLNVLIETGFSMFYNDWKMMFRIRKVNGMIITDGSSHIEEIKSLIIETVCEAFIYIRSMVFKRSYPIMIILWAELSICA